MKKVPYHLTEQDIRTYLKEEFYKAMTVKKEALSSPKITSLVDEIFKRFKSGEMSIDEAASLLNENLLKIIFVGENSPTKCKSCTKGNCKGKTCPVKKGFMTTFDIVKDNYSKYVWPNTLQKVSKSEDIIKIGEEKLEKGLNQYLQSNAMFGILSNMRGQKNEQNIACLIQSHLNNDATPGLLISGYKVFSSLKNLLSSYHIKVSNCQNDSKQVEHDIVTIVPVNDRVRVNFTQAKATLHLPWPYEPDRKEKIISACENASHQIIRDLDAFLSLSEHFLTNEEFQKIDLSFSLSITSLENIPEKDICNNCRNYIFEENKEGKACKDKRIFGIADLLSPTESSLEIFKTLAALYVGGASLVELKTPGEGYTREKKHLGLVNEKMKNLLCNTSQGKSEKEKMIKLGPDQNNIFMSGIGLNESYAVIAPWGGGKSVLLELELHRAVELYNESKEPVKIFLVVYEMKATNLLKHYQTLVDDLKLKKTIQIEVMNLMEICDLYSVQHEIRDTTSVINDLCKALSEKIDDRVCLFMDEVIIENPGIPSLEDLLGKVPFVLDGELFPWSDLDSHGVNLMVCINPECQDLAGLQNFNAGIVSSLKEKKPDQGSVPTVAMWRAFRSTNAINQFIQELESECSSKDKEFGYLIPPDAARQGHEIRGDVPIWIEAPKHQHVKCRQSTCENCFLLRIKDSFDNVIEELKRDSVADEDILVILSASASTKDSKCTFGKQFLKSTYPELNIKSNFEFDGCEAKVVIVVRNGGLLSFSLSNAISRAVSKLILFMPDDDKILENCYRKGLLVNLNKHSPIINSAKDESTLSKPSIPNIASTSQIYKADGFSINTSFQSETNPCLSNKMSILKIMKEFKIMIKRTKNFDKVVELKRVQADFMKIARAMFAHPGAGLNENDMEPQPVLSQIFPADRDSTPGDALGPERSSSKQQITGPGSSKNDAASYSTMVSSSLDPCCSTSSLDDFSKKKTISKKRNSCHEIVVNKRFKDTNGKEEISSWKTLESEQSTSTSSVTFEVEALTSSEINMHTGIFQKQKLQLQEKIQQAHMELQEPGSPTSRRDSTSMPFAYRPIGHAHR